MARPKNTTAPDLSQRVNLTAGVIERLTCPTEGKAQAFLRDSVAPGLRVRVTNTGAKSFVFEAKLNRKTIRRTIGDVRAWSIEQARVEARRLAVLLDEGTDPRELERQQQAEQAAESAAAVAQAVTVADAWSVYVAERRPHWGQSHLNDHERHAKAGGVEAKRGTRGRGKTIAGPLYPLMSMKLAELNGPAIEAWAEKEAQTRPTTTRLAWRLLRAFLGWCTEHPEFSAVVSDRNPAKTRKTREVLGKPGVKEDSLQREQLPAWFAAVQGLPSPAVAAYLQVLLLTGARPGEILAMRWEDVNTKWKGLTIKDKVEGERVIPLTPYVAHLLAALPRRNQYVFASPVKTEAAQPIAKPHKAHERACKVAAVEGLTLHGLRRSFASLTEWLEIPAGVVAQLQGHKPSATAEKHYKRRPLDLLRVHHERIEAWALEQAGIKFDPKAAAASAPMRVVRS